MLAQSTTAVEYKIYVKKQDLTITNKGLYAIKQLDTVQCHTQDT